MTNILNYMINSIDFKYMEQFKKEYESGQYLAPEKCPSFPIVKAYSDAIRILASNNNNREMSTENIIKNERFLITPKECMEILGVGRNRMYDLLKEKDFPMVSIGSKMYINKAKLQSWIDKNSKSA